MTSLVARLSKASAGVMRKMGSAFDSMGKSMEVAKYTENLVPSTRFVAVDGVGPAVSEQSFVAPSASVVGDVTIGKSSSVWYGAVVRGDVNTVTVGDNSSVGDRAVVHVAKIQGDLPTTIGHSVTIGAGAVVHAATVQDAVVIGEAAQVLDGSIVETNSVVAPAAVVTPGTTVKTGELWAGSPAKKVRQLTEEEIAAIVAQANAVSLLAEQHSVENAKDYQQILEEEELKDIETYLDESAPRPPPKDPSDILGQGQPGRVFRSTLTHPEKATPQQVKPPAKH